MKPDLPPDASKKSRKTFANFDTIRLDAFAHALTSFLRQDQALAEQGLVVSLHAPFGTGKSTFFEMWKNDLLQRREDGECCPIPVILNAWETDFCGDPFLAIASGFETVIDELCSTDSAGSEKKSAFKDAAKDVAWYGLGLANGIMSKLTGVDAIKAGEFAQKQKEKRGNQEHDSLVREDLFQNFKDRVNALRRLKDALQDCLGGDDLRAIVMVDELDRCRPDYAIEYLETIKHVFDTKGIAFVLAVDRDQLESSAKSLFGAGLNFNEYYRKFVSRQVPLPGPDQGRWDNFISACYGKFIQPESNSQRPPTTYGFNRGDFIKRGGEVQKMFSLNPRQMEEAFRIVGHLLACDESRAHQLRYGWSAAALFMSAALVANPVAFDVIGTQFQDYKKWIKHMGSILKDSKSARWWVGIFLSAMPWDISNVTDICEACYAAGMIKQPTESALSEACEGFDNAWCWSFGDESSPLFKLHKLMNGLRPFLDFN